jgi:peptidoglycan/LPS O-acetylase OafA/YrhL
MVRAVDLSRLDGLQSLRGFAAAYVFLFHLMPASGLGGDYPAISEIARWGFSGVDLFFVLSGFVMWHTTYDKEGATAALHFLLKRFARIYLGYWPMLAITVVVFLLLAPRALTGKNFIGSLLLLEPDDLRLVISVAWSLAYELYFYALFAGLVLVGRTARLFLVGLGLFGVAAFNLWLLACCPERLSGGTTEGYFFLSPFAAEFFAGSLLAASYSAGFHGLERRWVALMGIGLVCLGGWFGVGGGELPVHQVQRLGSFGLAAWGLILAVVALGDTIRWPRWSVALGDQSYSLYLGHPVLLSVAALTGLFGPLQRSSAGVLPGLAALFLAGILITYLYYRTIERPLYRWACRRIDA